MTENGKNAQRRNLTQKIFNMQFSNFSIIYFFGEFSKRLTFIKIKNLQNKV